MTKKQKINKIPTYKLSLSICLLLALTPMSCNNPANSYTNKLPPALLKKLQPEAEKIIQQAISDNDPQIQTKAIEVIADTEQTKLMPKIVNLLQSSSVPVRFSAALATGDLKYQPAKKQLSYLLQDKNKNVQIAAAFALYKLGDKEKIKLIQKAIEDKNQTLRANATFLLGKSGDKTSLKALYWVMRNENSSDAVSLQAAQAIAQLRDGKIYSKIWTMLISTYANDRLMGARAMGALGSLRAKNALFGMLNDNVLEVRLVAAEQLGKLNDNLGTPTVIEVFEKNLLQQREIQDQIRVKVLTTLAIGQICDEKLTKFLPKLIKDESKFVRIAAAKAVFLCINKTKSQTIP